MKKLDWRNTLLYGLFTGLTLAILWIFAEFIAEKTGTIETSLLIIGATGGTAILLYLFLRWSFSTWIRNITTDQLEKLSTLKTRYEKNANEPLLKRDFNEIVDNLLNGVIPILWHYARSILAVIVFMTVTVGLLALANAAVMYLQAKRLHEQNELIELQNRAQQASFVSASLSSLIIAQDRAHAIQTQIDQNASALSGTLERLESMVNQRAEGMVELVDLTPNVCPSEALDECNFLSIESLRDYAKTDASIKVTIENSSTLRAYIRLMKASTLSIELFAIAFGSKEEDAVRNGVIAYENAIKDTMNTCNATEPGSQAQVFWEGIKSMGIGSRGFFGSGSSVEIVVPGKKLEFFMENVILFSHGVDTIARTLNEYDALSEGPVFASSIFSHGLKGLQKQIKSLVAECGLRRDELLQTIEYIDSERQCLLGVTKC